VPELNPLGWKRLNKLRSVYLPSLGRVKKTILDIEIGGLWYPYNQPDQPPTGKMPPKTTSSLLEESIPYPSIHLSEWKVGARHPRNKPSMSVPDQNMDTMELLPTWWEAIVTNQTRKERMEAAIAARPAIRNARKKALTRNS
jgi:hypothetical protein